MTKLNTREDIFSKVPVFEAIVRLALPTIVGQIILVIYNLADTFFIGMSGSDAMISSVAVCMPAFMILSAISNLFGVGGSSVIATELGKGERERAGHTSAFAFYGCIAMTVMYSLFVFVFMDGFVNMLGGKAADVHRFSREYLMYTVVIGGVFTSINAFFAHLVRSEGRSLQASIGVAFGGVMNILLDPLFMFVIMPKGMEPVAVAVATMLSNALATVYFVVVLVKERRETVLSFAVTKKMFRHHIPQRVITIGFPAFIMTLFENISYAVMDNLLSAFGIAVQAGIGVAKKINMLAHCIVRGMTQGVLPLIAYTHGAKNYRRMKKSVGYSCVISVALATLCMGLYLAFAPQLVTLFIPAGGESVKYGSEFLRILCVGAPFSACAYTMVSFFQAVGHAKESFFIAILRKGVVDIPLMFILSRTFSMQGIIAATPVTDALCCAVAVVMVLNYEKKKKEKHALELASAVQ